MDFLIFTPRKFGNKTMSGEIFTIFKKGRRLHKTATKEVSLPGAI